MKNSKLSDIVNCKTIEEVIFFLLQFQNALTYDESLIGRCNEIRLISNHLVGENEHLVNGFIKGQIFNDFLKNISTNSISSIPYIFRVVQLRLDMKSLMSNQN